MIDSLPNNRQQWHSWLRKFLQLNWSDRQVLFSAFVLVILIKLGLKFLSFPQLLRILDRLSQPSRRRRSPAALTIDRITWLVTISANLVPGHTKCLVRALTAQVFLKRHQHPCELRIGVTRPDSNGNLEAHAWIESQGQIILGDLPDLAKYSPLM